MMVVLLINVKMEENTREKVKVYATDTYVTNDIEMIVDLMFAELVRDSGDMESYMNYMKQLCNEIRNDLEIDNLIGLTLVKGENGGDLILIEVFPIEAKEGFYADMFLDEERNKKFVLI